MRTLSCSISHSWTKPDKVKETLHVEWGTVVIVRLDKKPLQPEHLEALLAFRKFRLSPLITSARGHLEPGTKLDPYFDMPIKKEYRRAKRATDRIHAHICICLRICAATTPRFTSPRANQSFLVISSRSKIWSTTITSLRPQNTMHRAARSAGEESHRANTVQDPIPSAGRHET